MTTATPPTPDEIRAFLRTRVRVELENGDVIERTLSAFTPGDVILLADPDGFEVSVQRVKVRAVVSAQYTCAECDRRTNTRYAFDRCADCYRVWCQKQPVPAELCDDCDTPGAVYSPKFKVWRCQQCHAKNASFMGSHIEMLALSGPATADCRADDVESTRHDWVKVKSNSLCRKCNIKVFNGPANVAR